jgi:adenylate cyclase
MTRLSDLQACFEGVIPSIVATAAADGTPNVSYLSQVVVVDDDHIALSNQFFSKTAANIRENPHAAVLIVDAYNGEQYQLDVNFVESSATGEVFERVRLHIEATSAQAGMAGIFGLRGIDIYRVDAIARIASPVSVAGASEQVRSRLKDAACVVELIAAQSDVESIVDAGFEGLRIHFGFENTLLLSYDPIRRVLTTIASYGYDRAGIGSEVPPGGSLTSLAAAQARVIRVSDLSRVRRFIAAVRSSSDDENRTRTIAVPEMPDAMSQIAVPLMTQGQVHGVLFAESRARLAFTSEDEAALTIVARQIAAALMLAESLAAEAQEGVDAQHRRPPVEHTFRVAHYAFDDSVFVDNEYIIKGVSGRLLMFLLDAYQRDGRREFTNRELRLSNALRLPDVKDNLETRLLLLRRRLEEKAAPVRLMRLGGGRIALHLQGEPVLDRVIR